jgi:hypothetical protein
MRAGMCQRGIGRVYERSLESPVPMVLLVMWLVGEALLGFCPLTLYFLWRVLG